MNPNLTQALSWLGIKEATVPLFFNYLRVAGYLDETLIRKAVQYLNTEKVFDGMESSSVENIVASLVEASQKDTVNFLDTFASQLSPVDIVDLIIFLQQTAFDRNFGKERNLLTAKPWMEVPENQKNFMELQNHIGLVQEQLPQQQHYHAIGIMGASYSRVINRIRYFKDLVVDCDSVFAITGQRYLSKGLDGEKNIDELAKAFSLELHYVNENGQEITKETNETRMVMHLINTECSSYTIDIVDSAPGGWHWRTDTTQNAKDFAWTMMQRIQASDVRPLDGIYAVLLVVEQPYSNRMKKQVQRALNEAAQAHNIRYTDNIRFIVEASGRGLPLMTTLDEPSKIRYITQSNSDFAAWMGECYKDARLLIQQNHANLRAPDSLMYSTREAHFLKTTKMASPIAKTLGNSLEVITGSEQKKSEILCEMTDKNTSNSKSLR